MMDQLYCTYLTLLDELSGDMEKLAALAREKCTVVRHDDLAALNDVMKREQVVGLSVRGKEQKRQNLAVKLGLDSVRLSALPRNVPPELSLRAQETVETLRRSYSLYQEAAQVARTTLEINLHEIEKIIAAYGIDPAQSAGFRDAPPPEPPKNMKTDFRA